MSGLETVAVRPRRAWVDAVRRLLDDRSLRTQVLVIGVATSVGATVAVVAATSPVAWPMALAAGAGGLCVALVSTLLAGRSTRAMNEISAAAYALRRDDAPEDLQIPAFDWTRELRRGTSNLRRMVESARRRQQALESRNAALARRLEDRTHELTTLQELSIGLATKSDLQELVDEALEALGQTMDYTSASLWGRADREARGQVALLGYRLNDEADVAVAEDLTGMRLSRTNLQRYEQIERDRVPIVENQVRQSLLSWLWDKVTDDARSSDLYRTSRSWMAVPLQVREAVLGVMRVDHQEPDYFDPERARLLTAVSSQTALAMHHAQLLSQQREVAVIAERNRIARDLHDAVSQTLFAAKVLAGAMARLCSRDPPPAVSSLAAQAVALEKLNASALAEMRMLMFELRPDAMREAPVAMLLQHAIEALACRGDVVVQPSFSGDDALPAEVRLHVYRIAQEALSNVVRHSGAVHCDVEWAVHGARRATLRIADDGQGFEVDAHRPGHFGLDNMRSRAREIGAVLTLTSAAGQGTELLLELGSEET